MGKFGGRGGDQVEVGHGLDLCAQRVISIVFHIVITMYYKNKRVKEKTTQD